jgi:hypothetical protein
MNGRPEQCAVPAGDSGPDWRSMTPADAVMAQARAAHHREVAQEMRGWSDTTGALFELAAAEGLEGAAALALDPAMHVMHPLVPGLGGEAVARTKANTRNAPGLVDVPSTRPDMAAADASLERLRLAADAGMLTLATDMAETVNASNSAERALAHQMAAAHRLAMVLLAQANEDAMAYRHGATYGRQVQERATETARMADARQRIEEWRCHYNEERPHSALGNLTPRAFANKAEAARELA